MCEHSGMTPNHSLRYPADRWKLALLAARRRGTTLSSYITDKIDLLIAEDSATEGDLIVTNGQGTTPGDGGHPGP
jgi:hypothetical protein